MRCLIVMIALACAAPAVADALDARSAFVERRGILELDARCSLFAPNVRAALAATSEQARHALLREGWTSARVAGLEQTVIAAANARSCQDPRTVNSASEARRASATWLSAGSMDFPGWSQTWSARRVSTLEGWRLGELIDAASGARFGVRDLNGREQLVLALPLARGMAAPETVSLVMRDPARSQSTDISLPQRMSFGLSAGAPSPATSMTFTSVRNREGSEAIYVFPDLAFRNLIALDPRETVEARLDGQRSQVLLIEVGDVAVARAFLVNR
jgi:hypothetical protein